MGDLAATSLETKITRHNGNGDLSSHVSHLSPVQGGAERTTPWAEMVSHSACSFGLRSRIDQLRLSTVTKLETRLSTLVTAWANGGASTKKMIHSMAERKKLK